MGGLAGPRLMQTALPGGTVLKQRWNTHTFPFCSTWTRITSPQWPPFMVAGSVGQDGSSRYGFGSVRGSGLEVCATAGAPIKATIIAAKQTEAIFAVADITLSLLSCVPSIQTNRWPLPASNANEPCYGDSPCDPFL